MLAIVSSAALLGVDGFPVTVEVFVGGGVPSFGIVGLPDTICRESRDRVRAAIISQGFTFPRQRVTVNLAPTGLRKAGAGLDLAIAIGLLIADGTIEQDQIQGVGFVGELGLDGTIRSVPGVLSLVDAIDEETVVVPTPTVIEAELVGRHRVRTAPCLGVLVEALTGKAAWPEFDRSTELPTKPVQPDLADVAGQPLGRHALEIAAAGGHHVLMIGPPGAGKTMLASRLPGLLPALNAEVALEVTRVHSAAGVRLPPGGLVRWPPFRAPHHGLSAVALVGGGSATIAPGEISLAHGGVLFLDELGEFGPSVLDALRQPLEEGVVRIARSQHRATIPARFLLVGAMNPCPCGQGAEPGACRCGTAALARYARRLSGPLVDRFDLRIQVGRPEPNVLIEDRKGEPSGSVAERVARVRRRAAQRGVLANAHLHGAELEKRAPLSPEARDLLRQALMKGSLSGRGLERVRAVALTIADLDGVEPPLSAAHVTEAIHLRIEIGSDGIRLAG